MTLEESEVRAEQAARDARKEIRRRNESSLIPIAVVMFAVLSAVALFALDNDDTSPAPQPAFRADSPAPQQ